MSAKQTGFIQTARMPVWLCLVWATFIAGFAILFIPFSHQNPALWFLSLFLLSFIGVYFGVALTTRVVKDSNDEYCLLIPDHSSNTTQRIPVNSIVSIENCHYSLFFNTFLCPDDVNKDFFYQKSLFGYAGQGVIISYRLDGEKLTRGIVLPSPKAASFISFITTTN
jgi:hypothetical protein